MPDVWALLSVCALVALSFWVIIRATVRVVKRDWILASLMLVTLPILGSWLFNLEQVGGLVQSSGFALHQWDAAMAYVLIVLAGASATFIRLRQRVLKTGALVTLGVIAFTKTGEILWGDIGFLGFLITAVLFLLFLLSPAILEASIGRLHNSSK
ncbi:hypothetical protein ACFLXF_02285 [Chloroflexota bacterium]